MTGILHNTLMTPQGHPLLDVRADFSKPGYIALEVTVTNPENPYNPLNQTMTWRQTPAAELPLRT